MSDKIFTRELKDNEFTKFGVTCYICSNPITDEDEDRNRWAITYCHDETNTKFHIYICPECTKKMTPEEVEENIRLVNSMNIL